MSRAKQWDPEKLRPNSRNLMKLELAEFKNGIRIEIPFFVLLGKKPRPRALLIAGVHGDEYESVAALQELANEIDPGKLSGVLTILPVANPQAFYAGSRRNPVDLGDLNRCFPGSPEGTVSERLANILFNEIALRNHFILSLHCWSKEATVIPYVEYPDEETSVARKSFRAASALGLEFLHPYKWHPGLLVAAATRFGIPAIEPEVGGMGTVTPAGQRTYRDLVYRFLQHLKMFEPENIFNDPPYLKPKIIDHTDCLANFAGLFRSRINPGDNVKVGDILGTVHNLAGKCLEEVRAPKEGTVGILRTFCSVQPGDRLAQIFWEKSAPPKGPRARLTQKRSKRGAQTR